MNAHEMQPATVSDRTMQKFRMRTLNHSQNEEYLLLWIDNEKLQNLFAKHTYLAFCSTIQQIGRDGFGGFLV